MPKLVKLYVRLNSATDSATPAVVLGIMQARHRNYIFDDIIDAYWRSYAEETMVLTVYDAEYAIVETIDQLKFELGHDFVAFDDDIKTV